MKNAFAAVVFSLGLIACADYPEIVFKPDAPSGSGGNGGNPTMGAGGNDAGTCQCDNGDGTRLTRQYLVGDDGSKMETVVWHDNKLGLNCSYQSLPNGQTYCVPPHDTANTYIDAGCMIPAYIEVVQKTSTDNDIKCQNKTSYVRFDTNKPSLGCGFPITDEYVFYSVNKDTFARTNVYYTGSPASCQKTDLTGNPFQDAALWSVTEIGDLQVFTKAVSGVGF